MTENQRMQQERYDLRGPDRSVRVTSQGSVAAFTVLGLVVLAALVYAAVQGIDNWWQGLVLAVIVLTAVGLMIAVSPNRRG
jgi:peptidoglycan/LPS O-acetylase OafA/YrhL